MSSNYISLWFQNVTYILMKLGILLRETTK